MKTRNWTSRVLASAALACATIAPAGAQTISQLTADGQTFDAYFQDHDGQEWLLIGRGREGWEFDSDGQGAVGDVSVGVGTTAAFAPKCYSDAIIIDLLNQQGDASVANLTVRLSRASDTTGAVEFQDVRWTAFVGNGDAFTWDMGAGSATYALTTEFKNAPAGLPGATTGVFTGSNSRDANHGNDARRIFTWAWGGHSNQRGFAYGQSVNAGTNSPTNFLWESGTENHSLPYTEVYIPYVSGPDVTAPAIAATDPADEATGAYPGGNLVATFSEKIALTGAGTITITDTDDGSGNQVITLPNAGVTVSDAVLTIDPATNLEFGTNYEITIDGLAIEDQAAIPNAFAGTAAGDWNFQTAAVDGTPPVITALSPLDDETAAGPGDDLVITFDENILLNSGAATTLLDENFDSGDGGFTLKVAGAAGTPWAYGVPDSNSEFGGGALTTDNSGSGSAWATGLGDFTGTADRGYFVDPTSTCLRSGIIDLTSVASATLTFAEAIDLDGGDTAVVNIIESATDTVIATVYNSVDGDNASVEWAPANGGAAIDLSAGIGQMVRLEWCLDGVGGTTDDFIGWYIDDVQVTGFDAANSITLKNLTASTDTVIPVSDSSQISVVGAVLTINPAGLLSPGADFAVQIGATAIRNFNDLDFAGIADNTTWNFTTAADSVFITSANTGVNGDTWTAGANWDIGAMPSGVLTGTIQTGLTALANSDAVVTYSGGLTLETNSTLQIGSGGSTENRDESALALGTGTVTMEAGSKIQWQMKVSPTVPPLVLNGDASIVLASNEAHARNFTFSGGISGPGQLTFDGVNNNSHTFNTANPAWTGGFVGGISSNCRTRFNANVAGSLGTGDVTINNCADLAIGGPGDAIDDSATLSLNGSGRDQSPDFKLIMTGSDTVDQAFRDGYPLQPGTYGKVGLGGVDNEVTWIDGNGVLTVSSVAGDATAPTVVSIDAPPALNPIYGTPTITFTVTFDEDIDGTTVDVGDFSNAGTAPISIGTITQTNASPYPGVFTVEVNPSGAGTVDLQVGASINDVAGNTLAAPASGGPVYTLDTSAQPARETITVDAVDSYATRTVNVPRVISFDASLSDKLVVIATAEHGFNNTAGIVNSVTYNPATDAAALTLVVERLPVTNGSDIGYASIWYLDNPPAGGANELQIAAVNREIVTIIGLSGTAPDFGITSIGDYPGLSTDLITATENSLVVAALAMGGNGNTGNTGATDPVGPDLIEVAAPKDASNWLGHVTATQNTTAPTSGPFAFTTNQNGGYFVIAAEFQAAEIIGGNAYDSWSGGFAGLSDPTYTVDFDGGGLPTGIEWVVGGDPTDPSDDSGLAPKLDTATSPGNALFEFRRTDAAAADGNTSIKVEYGTTLIGWTDAVDGVDGVVITVDDDFYGAGVDKVTASLPDSLAVAGELYARLNVVVTP